MMNSTSIHNHAQIFGRRGGACSALLVRDVTTTTIGGRFAD